MYSLLTTPTNNPKMLKSLKTHPDYISAILHLAPSDLSGKTVCPYAKIAKCEDACLNTAGRGGIFKKGSSTNVIQEARLRKTKLFHDHYDSFMFILIQDITKLENYCAKKGKLPCVRLNGTSDIQWEHLVFENKTIFEHFPHIQFYDYTKIPTRKIDHVPNYHLTWSYSEANAKFAHWFDKIQHNIAVVFNGEIPMFFKGMKVINGDESDMRFLDEPNVVVGLKAKGKAKHDTSGFVIQTITMN